MSERLSLHGKVAVITGGSRGIGLALARAFTHHGCNVVISGRESAPLQSAADELNRSSKAEVLALSCDVSQPSEVEKLFAAVAKRYPALDVLVNNAGIAHGLAPVDRISVEAWKQVIDVNLTGMFLCTRAALPLMREGSTIVNNLSVAAVRPFEGMAAYNASKYGARGFTNALREDLRPRGIRVLALMPGATNTAIWDQFWPEAPRKKMLSTATVAEAVVHVVTLPPDATIEEIKIGPASGTL